MLDQPNASRELLDLALTLERMGDFLARPDLNQELIGRLDWHARKLFDAVAAMERLEAENERLRAALTEIARVEGESDRARGYVHSVARCALTVGASDA